MPEKSIRIYSPLRKLLVTIVLSLIVLASLEAIATVAVLRFASPVLKPGSKLEAQPDPAFDESYKREDQSVVTASADPTLPVKATQEAGLQQHH